MGTQTKSHLWNALIAAWIMFIGFLFMMIVFIIIVSGYRSTGGISSITLSASAGEAAQTLLWISIVLLIIGGIYNLVIGILMLSDQAKNSLQHAISLVAILGGGLLINIILVTNELIRLNKVARKPAQSLIPNEELPK